MGRLEGVWGSRKHGWFWSVGLALEKDRHHRHFGILSSDRDLEGEAKRRASGMQEGFCEVSARSRNSGIQKSA